jgi:hypothetical protein
MRFQNTPFFLIKYSNYLIYFVNHLSNFEDCIVPTKMIAYRYAAAHFDPGQFIGKGGGKSEGQEESYLE